MKRYHILFPIIAVVAVVFCFSPQMVEAQQAGSLRYEGTMMIAIHDDIDGSVEEHHFLVLPDGRELRMLYQTHEARRIVRVSNGKFRKPLLRDAVRVWGKLNSRGEIITERIEAPQAPLETSSGVLDVIGEKKMCLVVISFPNRKNELDPDQLLENIFGTGHTTNSFYQEASRNKFWVAGIQDPDGDLFEVTVDTDGCTSMSYSQVSDQALSQVEATGIDVDAYRHRCFYFPRNSPGCPGGGIGGGNNAWIFGIDIRGVWDYTAHEAAHGFGFGHASSYDNCSSQSGNVTTASENPTSCTHNEYGDMTDVMGGRNFMFCSWHMEKAGWLEDYNVLVLEQSARVTLVPMELEAEGIQSLRVPRKDGSTFWQFEYRQKIGEFDKSIETALTSGPLVRFTGDPNASGRNLHIIDMTPNNDLRDAALAVGRTFKADNDAIRVTTISADAHECVIDVVIDGIPVNIHKKKGNLKSISQRYFFFKILGTGTMVKLPLESAGMVKSIEVMGPTGRVMQQLNAEKTVLNWNGICQNGKPISSGIYFLKFICSDKTISKTAVVIR